MNSSRVQLGPSRICNTSKLEWHLLSTYAQQPFGQGIRKVWNADETLKLAVQLMLSQKSKLAAASP